MNGRGKPAPSVINLFSVSYLDDKDFKFLVMDAANQPVIAHTIPPKALEVSDKHFSFAPWVRQVGNLVHIVKDSFLN